MFVDSDKRVSDQRSAGRMPRRSVLRRSARI